MDVTCDASCFQRIGLPVRENQLGFQSRRETSFLSFGRNRRNSDLPVSFSFLVLSSHTFQADATFTAEDLWTNATQTISTNGFTVKVRSR